MSPNKQESATPICLTEKKFNSLQKKAHYQLLIHANNSIFFVPLPKLATTFSHQVIVINERTALPEQVYYNQMTLIVVDGKHFIVKATNSDSFFLKTYWWFVALLSGTIK